MSFCVHESTLVLCNSECVVIYDMKNEQGSTISLCDLDADRILEQNVPLIKIDTEAFHSITIICFSNDGKYFLVCTNRKRLYLFDSESRKLISNRNVPRAASKARFTPRNDIIVADKSGDAYLFFTDKPMEKGNLILGHSSMLLDILVTNDDKYIITTDRDEKIRVSMFPNSYNILSYCLGHTKFVTNIMELPHNKSILISSGGDGTFILWDYKNGTELLQVDFSEKISKKDVSEFKEGLRQYHPEESIETLPVKHMKVSYLADESSLLIFTFYHSKTVLVYIINNSLKTNIQAKYLESIDAKEEPLDCLLNEQDLWILTDFGLNVYRYEKNGFINNGALNDALISVNADWDSLKKAMSHQNLFPILYKRKYDNVQEYLERKKLRVATPAE